MPTDQGGADAARRGIGFAYRRGIRRPGRGHGSGKLAVLQAQCEARAPLFEPAAEKAALLAVLNELP